MAGFSWCIAFLTRCQVPDRPCSLWVSVCVVFFPSSILALVWQPGLVISVFPLGFPPVTHSCSATLKGSDQKKQATASFAVAAAQLYSRIWTTFRTSVLAQWRSILRPAILGGSMLWFCWRLCEWIWAEVKGSQFPMCMHCSDEQELPPLSYSIHYSPFSSLPLTPTLTISIFHSD